MSITEHDGKANAKAFSKRLNQACDDCDNIPEYGKGRQVVVANRMGVSQEAVRKWFAGESMPKAPKVKKLASILEVDVSWLVLGEKPELNREAKRLAGRVVEGSVMLIAGSLQMEGAVCAFPAEDDPRKGYVDFYTIIRGEMLPVHVSVAKEISSDLFEVIVPREYVDVTCIAYFPVRTGMFHLIELPTALIDRHKTKRAGDFTLRILRDGLKYLSGDDKWPRFNPTGGKL